VPEHIFPRKKASDWSVGSLYVVFLRMVAGGRNAPNTPVLVLPYRFELIRELAA
jgi:hypothetical protein